MSGVRSAERAELVVKPHPGLVSAVGGLFGLGGLLVPAVPLDRGLVRSRGIFDVHSHLDPLGGTADLALTLAVARVRSTTKGFTALAGSEGALTSELVRQMAGWSRRRAVRCANDPIGIREKMGVVFDPLCMLDLHLATLLSELLGSEVHPRVGLARKTRCAAISTAATGSAR